MSMTTAQNQVVAIKGLLLTAAMFLFGCGASTKSTYRIDGAATDFCVPSAIDVTPTRPDERDVILGGFAINGCWKSDQDACIGSQELITLSVTGKASFIGRRFGNFPSDSHVKEVANEGKTIAEPIGKHLIVIPDSVDAKKRFVWSVVDIHKSTMSDDDELMAVCAQKSEAEGYFCDRKIVESDYLVGYSFFAGREIPTTIELLDKQVIEGVESLRCNPHK